MNRCGSSPTAACCSPPAATRANRELRQQYQPPMTDEWTSGVASNTGDALLAGIDIGADTALLDEAWFAPGVVAPDGRPVFYTMVWSGIWVNAGRRALHERAPPLRPGRPRDPAGRRPRPACRPCRRTGCSTSGRSTGTRSTCCPSIRRCPVGSTSRSGSRPARSFAPTRWRSSPSRSASRPARCRSRSSSSTSSPYRASTSSSTAARRRGTA